MGKIKLVEKQRENKEQVEEKAVELKSGSGVGNIWSNLQGGSPCMLNGHN